MDAVPSSKDFGNFRQVRLMESVVVVKARVLLLDPALRIRSPFEAPSGGSSGKNGRFICRQDMKEGGIKSGDAIELVIFDLGPSQYPAHRRNILDWSEKSAEGNHCRPNHPAEKSAQILPHSGTIACPKPAQLTSDGPHPESPIA
jgi:hypothetical protein